MTAPDWLDCRRLAADLVDLAEGTLAPERRAAVRAHLGSCPECRATLEALEVAPARIGALAPEDDGARWERQRRAILAGIDTAGAAEGSRSRRRWRLAGLSVAAGILLALLGVERVERVDRLPSGVAVAPRPTPAPDTVEDLSDEVLLTMAETLSAPTGTLGASPHVVPDVESLSDEELDALDDFLGPDLV